MKSLILFFFFLVFSNIYSQIQNTATVKDTVYILFDRKQPEMYFSSSAKLRSPEIYGDASIDSIPISYGYTYQNKTMASFFFYGRPTKELKRAEKHFNRTIFHPIVKTVDLSYLSNKTILGFEFFTGKDFEYFENYFFEGGQNTKTPNKHKFIYLIDIDEIEHGMIKLRQVSYMNRVYE